MSISTKSKHNIWSRILLGIVAIFVSSQELTFNEQLNSANYQNQLQQSPQQKIQLAVAAIQQIQQNQGQSPKRAPHFEKLFENALLFLSVAFPAHAPIRAGPQFA